MLASAAATARRRNSAPPMPGPRTRPVWVCRQFLLRPSLCLVVRLFVWLLRGRCGAPRSPSRAFEPPPAPQRRRERSFKCREECLGPICARCRFKREYQRVCLLGSCGQDGGIGSADHLNTSFEAHVFFCSCSSINSYCVKSEEPPCRAARHAVDSRPRQRPLRARRPRRPQLPRTRNLRG